MLATFLPRFVIRLVFVLLCVTLAAAPASAMSRKDEAALREALTLSGRGQWTKAVSLSRRAQDSAVFAAVEWMYLTDSATQPGFGEIRDFLDGHPGWPRKERLLARAETALAKEARHSEALEWLTRNPPATANGHWALGEAMLARRKGNRSEAVMHLRLAWREGIEEKGEYTAFLARHAEHLTQEDYIQRVGNLLWHEHTRAAEKWLTRLPENYRKLYEARIKLIRDEAGFEGAIRKVPSSLKNDPGLLYDRIAWRARKGKEEGVIELVREIPASVPFPEKWAAYRMRAARELLQRGAYGKAYAALRGHGLSSGQDFAEIEWLAGWIKQRFLHDPREAYKHFYALYSGVSYPVSLARAAYWAGKAAESNGNGDIAKRWLSMAAKHSTTFYGQLALHALEPTPRLTLPPTPKPGGAERRAFESREIVRAALALDRLGKLDTARALMLHLADTARTPGEAALVVELGKRTGREGLPVRLAKQVLRQGFVVADTGWPLPDFKLPGGLDAGLVAGLIRQESEFDRRAKSSAGAMGLMQLMPPTAKLMAKKQGLGYAEKRLYEPAYNVQLGTYYLARLVEGFDGSLPLAIASYNAGPGKVREWIKRFGNPALGQVAALDWIELIPYAETRNYVQRVLENAHVYRALMPRTQGQPLTLAEDLKLEPRARRTGARSR